MINVFDDRTLKDIKYSSDGTIHSEDPDVERRSEFEIEFELRGSSATEVQVRCITYGAVTGSIKSTRTGPPRSDIYKSFWITIQRHEKAESHIAGDDDRTG